MRVESRWQHFRAASWRTTTSLCWIRSLRERTTPTEAPLTPWTTRLKGSLDVCRTRASVSVPLPTECGRCNSPALQASWESVYSQRREEMKVEQLMQIKGCLHDDAITADGHGWSSRYPRPSVLLSVLSEFKQCCCFIIVVICYTSCYVAVRRCDKTWRDWASRE